MSRFTNRRDALAVLAVLLAVTGLQAQTTTGRLIGTVTDAGGQPLPGVTVTISSPALIGGAQMSVSDSDGSFQFISLAPGVYTVRADLSGFVSQERNEVKVPLGGAASLLIPMAQGSFEGEIEVVAETPVVDPTQVNTEQVYDLGYMQQSAVGSRGRDYLLIVGQTAGVTGGTNPNVFGSTSDENAYYIDGQDTTDPVTATWSVQLNYDSIAEVEMQTSGFEAQYGRATGGLINVVTKSGGNQFNGTVDIRYRDDNFQEDGDHYDTETLDSKFQDIAATLGGPILRDNLWFFAAYEDVLSETTPNGSPTTFSWDGYNWNAKLTWQAGASWRLIGKATQSPADISNANASQFVEPEANSFQKQGTDLYTAELNGVISDSLMWTTTVGAYRSILDTVPQTGDLVTASHANFDTGIFSRNYSNQQYSERNRDDVSTDLTWFVDNLAGSHEFKGGIQYSGTDFSSANCSTGTTGGACGPDTVGYQYQDVTWFGPTTPYFMWEYSTAGAQTYTGTLWTAYLQDAWRVIPNLTLKLGIRQDQVKYDNNAGVQIADMSKFQPRVGLAWDITGNAKNVVRANWGVFMHPNALTLPNFVRAADEPSAKYYSCGTIVNAIWGVGVTTPEECAAWAESVGFGYNPGYDGTDPLGWILHPAEIYGSGENGIDPNLRATYADTLSVSYERQVGRRASLELTYVDKKTEDIFEDTCEGNLGPDGPSEGASCDSYVMANLPGLTRDYEGLMLKYETRTFSWLTVLASYTYSKSRGNQEANQQSGSDFDFYPWHFDNRYGYLNDHREHRFKLNGFFNIKGDWTIGFDGFWSSAFTWELQEDPGDNIEIPYGVHYLEPRGSNEAFDAYNLDLQLSKGFTISGVRLVLIGSVYNTFSTEYGTGVCNSVSGCGEYEPGDATTWRRPRSYEVGFRIEF
jgi:hypothetical protein